MKNASATVLIAGLISARLGIEEDGVGVGVGVGAMEATVGVGDAEVAAPVVPAAQPHRRKTVRSTDTAAGVRMIRRVEGQKLQERPCLRLWLLLHHPKHQRMPGATSR
jgi:hypothetical protein